MYRFTSLLLFGLLVSLNNANSQSPPPSPPGPPPSPPGLIDRSPTAVIELQNGSSVRLHSHHWRFPHIIVPVNQTIDVYLRFTPDLAGTELTVAAADGGTISSEGLTIANNGTVSFQFQPGTQPGVYRVFVNASGDLGLFEFEVADQ